MVYIGFVDENKQTEDENKQTEDDHNDPKIFSALFPCRLNANGTYVGLYCFLTLLTKN